MRGGADLPLNPHAPPHFIPRLACSRATCGQLIAMCMCWGGKGGGAGPRAKYSPRTDHPCGQLIAKCVCGGWGVRWGWGWRGDGSTDSCQSPCQPPVMDSLSNGFSLQLERASQAKSFSEALILSFIMSDLSESLTVAHLS